jgi:uncharacterized DUF497 family protein
LLNSDYNIGEKELKLEGRVVVIVHTPRQNKTRIISMRKANHREQKIYQKRLNQN